MVCNGSRVQVARAVVEVLLEACDCTLRARFDRSGSGGVDGTLQRFFRGLVLTALQGSRFKAKPSLVSYRNSMLRA